MDESKALKKLMDAVDLISMLEELTTPGTVERLNGGSLSGLRLTLRSIRESVLSGHDVLAGEFVERSKASASFREVPMSLPVAASSSNPPVAAPSVSAERSNGPIVRKDLRTSLERFAEQRANGITSNPQ